VVLDRDALAADESLLRRLWGLLVHAHYRTTPGDLHRLLDAPNLAVHAVVDDGAVVGACLVAREGALPAARCAALARGEDRLRGHALADTLITHAARPDAGTLPMLRSVRIAVHPAARRRHVARQLVDHVHATAGVALFGTMFGATAPLVRFRQACGYVVVRVGVGRGARSGEPAVVMVRPGSAAGAGTHAAARTLVDELRAELARDLPLQLRLIDADGGPRLDDALVHALGDGLGAAEPLRDEAIAVRVRRYLAGPQPAEAAVAALAAFVARVDDAGGLRGGCLTDREALLVRGRLLQHRPWAEVAAWAGYPTTARAMRALRPAVARLWATLGGTLFPSSSSSMSSSSS
jgi:tRNA(Met) cytidine acetyltransferase